MFLAQLTEKVSLPNSDFLSFWHLSKERFISVEINKTQHILELGAVYRFGQDADNRITFIKSVDIKDLSAEDRAALLLPYRPAHNVNAQRRDITDAIL